MRRMQGLQTVRAVVTSCQAVTFCQAWVPGILPLQLLWGLLRRNPG